MERLDYTKENEKILLLKNKSYTKPKFSKIESADNLFIIYAKQRSGHHGILDWIRFKFSESYHFNDPDLGDNVVDTCTKFWSNNVLYENKEKDLSGKNLKNVFINYENYFFDKNSEEHEINLIKKSFINRPKNIYRILILRDYFNNLASCLNNPHQTYIFREMWLNHAREFVGETNFIDSPLYIINFNDWAKLNWYRLTLSDQFDFSFKFDSPNNDFLKTSQHGGGSSFDGMTKQNSPLNMNLLNRYKTLNKEQINSIFKDAEVMLYMNKIFNKNLISDIKNV